MKLTALPSQAAATARAWQMAVFNGRLYIGTFDASALQGGTEQYGADLWRIDSSDSPAVNEDYTGLGDRYNYGIRILQPLEDGSGLVAGMQGPDPAAEYGADLWRFDSSSTPAVNENYVGLGDIFNYGIRILHPLDDGSGLIAGMANPFNLKPGGGWELRLLKEAAPVAKKPKRSR